MGERSWRWYPSPAGESRLWPMMTSFPGRLPLMRSVLRALRGVRARYLRRVKLYRGLHRFLPILLALEGARIAERPVSHRPRRFGRSKYGVWNRLGPALVDLVAFARMQRGSSQRSR